MNELFTAIFKLLPEGEWSDQGYTYDDGNLRIEMYFSHSEDDAEAPSESNKQVSEFMKYVESLDNDIFVAACDEFGNENIKVMNSALKNNEMHELTDDFLAIVKRIINQRIDDAIFTQISACEEIQRKANAEKEAVKESTNDLVDHLREQLIF